MKKADIVDKKGFIIDMDGVIYHGSNLLPGAMKFVNWLQEEKKDFLFLTNSSERSPKELQQKLKRFNINVSQDNFYTSALATASFLSSQQPEGSAYVIGEAGLINALYNVGFSMDEVNPDYVVVGDTRTYNYEKIEHAARLVIEGAKLIGTNPDLTGPSEEGIVPATKALTAPIELTSGKEAYYVGKPNPLMMRDAMKKLGTRSEDTVIIGDRMDTDIIAGIESEIDTVLLLSGVTDEQTINNFSYRPDIILSGIADVVD